ncbi:MAG: MFS transporter [Bacteriovorax sp.]|nr:MFS transporter [Bacteriovorax sp.]
MEKNKIFNLTVLVVTLGYFVDIFDLTLFNMLRIPSLKALQVPEDQLVEVGIFLLNWQMAGMLLGGLFWGILGDKKGRTTVLFGSIVLYSVANILNGFVTTIPQYAVLRFLSGIGLAGELGAGITLISEILPANKRGLGTTIVATIGVLGASCGGLMVEHFDWRTCYFVGGVLGLALLFLRVQISDSSFFSEHRKNSGAQWGNISTLFKSKNNFLKFILCIGVGVPIWYVAGLLMNFSPEIAQEIGVTDSITAARSIGISYLGLAVGDLLSGLLSQKLESRIQTMKIFMLSSFLFIGIILFTSGNQSASYFYFWCFMIGVSAGYWAMFITIAAEQFGTNIRATVATSVPNFVRGSVIPMTLLFKNLKDQYTILNSVVIVGVIVFTIALISVFYLPETFHKDLNYLEE